MKTFFLITQLKFPKCAEKTNHDCRKSGVAIIMIEEFYFLYRQEWNARSEVFSTKYGVSLLDIGFIEVTTKINISGNACRIDTLCMWIHVLLYKILPYQNYPGRLMSHEKPSIQVFCDDLILITQTSRRLIF